MVVEIELSEHERWIVLDAIDAWIERQKREKTATEDDQFIVNELRKRIESTVSYEK